ncbi:ExbD/TolR family protein [Mariniblastus fucicola]|uniref:Biopolymer transport protein ExbD n=1 Tax=Mariniblastus fucicola TaxID=980251 RepID=A0A5B9P7I1_9BACT|nr:biopolymer transporter ExbD [Mariniblastus fucicola]QEG20910.1 biopolymer transport protein ExbD [Mariniblastus fucicola]
MPLKVQRDDQTAINLTPMIDIVFLLIIFFMVSSHFTNQTSTQERDIAIKVPVVSDAGALTAPPRHRVINIYDDGQVALDEDTVSIPELESKLTDARAQYEQLGVVVRGDGAVQYERVAEVIATCKKVRIQNLNIAVSNQDSVNR